MNRVTVPRFNVMVSHMIIIVLYAFPDAHSNPSLSISETDVDLRIPKRSSLLWRNVAYCDFKGTRRSAAKFSKVSSRRRKNVRVSEYERNS